MKLLTFTLWPKKDNKGIENVCKRSKTKRQHTHTHTHTSTQKGFEKKQFRTKKNIKKTQSKKSIYQRNTPHTLTHQSAD